MLTPERQWEKVGQVPRVVFVEGLVRKTKRWLFYYGGAEKRLWSRPRNFDFGQTAATSARTKMTFVTFTYGPSKHTILTGGCARKNRNAFCLPVFRANGRLFSGWFLNQRSV